MVECAPPWQPCTAPWTTVLLPAGPAVADTPSGLLNQLGTGYYSEERGEFILRCRAQC